MASKQPGKYRKRNKHNYVNRRKTADNRRKRLLGDESPSQHVTVGLAEARPNYREKIKKRLFNFFTHPGAFSTPLLQCPDEL